MAIFRRSVRSISMGISQLSVSIYQQLAFSGWLLVDDHGQSTIDHLLSSVVYCSSSVNTHKNPQRGKAEGFLIKTNRSACESYSIRERWFVEGAPTVTYSEAAQRNPTASYLSSFPYHKRKAARPYPKVQFHEPPRITRYSEMAGSTPVGLETGELA